MKYSIHPEVYSEVMTEFKRLHEKNPTVDGHINWTLAVAYVRTIAWADTYLLNQLIYEEVNS